MLEYFGFGVLQANSGKQALELLAQNEQRPLKDRLRLVILDLTMPGMDGREVLARMRGVRPDLPVVIMSGYVESDVMREFEGTRRVSFVHKPFALDELGALLQRALAPSRM